MRWSRLAAAFLLGVVAVAVGWQLGGLTGWLEAVGRAPLGQDVTKAVMGTLGIVSSIVTFAITNVIARPAMVRWRRAAWWMLALWWAAVVLCLVDVLRPVTLWGVPNVTVKVALVLWAFGLVRLLAMVWQILFVHRSALEALSTSELSAFERAGSGELGVAFLDRWAIQLKEAGRKLRFPLLLAADREAWGLETAQRFLVAGLHRGAGVVILTFTRPAATIVRQLGREVDGKRLSPQQFRQRVRIIDCYSSLYARQERTRAATYEGWTAPVVLCDPRDPIAVQSEYKRALRRLQRDGVREARVVYDSLTDFVSIADAELVVAYLRRMVVYEEQLGVQALYVLWPDVLEQPVSDRYLAWFFSMVLRLRNEDGVVTAALENLPETLGRARLDAGLDLADRGVGVNRDRLERLAQATRALGYRAVPMDDARLFPQGGERRDEAAFFFYMTAIDHRTAPPGERYEAELGGRRLRGSDLMYARANTRPELLTTERLMVVTESQVAELFRNDDGTTVAGPGLRAWLLRQAAQTLTDVHDGDVLTLLASCGNRLQASDASGLLQRLAAFRAYEDPLRKKSHLLAKILMRRGLFPPTDLERQEVPVDPVLVHMALRAGLVTVSDDELVRVLKDGRRLSEEQATRLRFVSLRAFGEVAERSGLPAYELDDLLWGLGRELARGSSLEAIASGPYAGGVEHAESLPRFLERLAGRDIEASGSGSKLIGLEMPPAFPDTWYY
jgi:hypothetical protein